MWGRAGNILYKTGKGKLKEEKAYAISKQSFDILPLNDDSRIMCYQRHADKDYKEE